ncbi:MAG: alanine racemase [Candidatus Humimicrobiaceae bacterium]
MQNTSRIYSSENRFAWVEINLEDLSENFKLIKDYISSFQEINTFKPKIMAVVKANAYGHGLIEISREAVLSGASWLGVALVHEGLMLREGGIKVPILCLGSHAPEKIRDAIENDITLSVTSLESAKLISDFCIGANMDAKVHIKIDTGMNRIGINYKNAIQSILLIKKLPKLDVDGVFTHFACASEKEESYTLMQWERFSKIIKELKAMDSDIRNYHCANSAAFIRYPHMHLDMVRLGIIIYGMNPFNNDFPDFCSKDASEFTQRLKPVLSLKAKISFIKRVAARESISYHGTFRTKKESIIATIPLGYADGYSRHFSNKSKMIFNDCFAPVVGNVTLDLTMIDLTDCRDVHKAKTGDEVVLIGKSNELNLTASELADLIGTINYEIVCMIGDRIPRLYL